MEPKNINLLTEDDVNLFEKYDKIGSFLQAKYDYIRRINPTDLEAFKAIYRKLFDSKENLCSHCNSTTLYLFKVLTPYNDNLKEINYGKENIETGTRISELSNPGNDAQGNVQSTDSQAHKRNKRGRPKASL